MRLEVTSTISTTVHDPITHRLTQKNKPSFQAILSLNAMFHIPWLLLGLSSNANEKVAFITVTTNRYMSLFTENEQLNDKLKYGESKATTILDLQGTINEEGCAVCVYVQGVLRLYMGRWMIIKSCRCSPRPCFLQCVPGSQLVFHSLRLRARYHAQYGTGL